MPRVALPRLCPVCGRSGERAIARRADWGGGQNTAGGEAQSTDAMLLARWIRRGVSTAANGRPPGLKALLEKQADIDSRDAVGRSP